MARWMVWTNDQGWACSQCEWRCPTPTLLGDEEAKSAFDRLASAKFRDHRCTDFPKTGAALAREEFASRVRQHISHGFKPKDAVELVLQEIMLERRHEPAALKQAQADAEDFLRRLRQDIS